MKSNFFRACLILVFCCLIYSSSSLSQYIDYKIIESNQNILIIEYYPKVLIEDFQIDGILYKRINLINGIDDESLSIGYPEIQIRKFLVGVPGENLFSLDYKLENKKTYEARLAPKPKIVKDKNKSELIAKYSESENYNQRVIKANVKSGNFFISRDIPIIEIIAAPFDYFPGENKLEIFEKITIVIRFNKRENLNSTIVYNDKLLDAAVINYNIAKKWHTRKSSPKKLNSSVLANGIWHKFYVEEEGIYKITAKELFDLGFKSSDDPRTIKIYNNGGYQLPENLSGDRPIDLVEIAIMAVGEEDGKLDADDYILFYGRSHHFFEPAKYDYSILRYFHPYCEENYYFITFGGNAGKRMSKKSSLQSENFLLQTQTKACIGFEEDLQNRFQTGRMYLGEEFNVSNRSKTYIHSVKGRVPFSEMSYFISFVNSSPQNINLNFYENDNLIGNAFAQGVGFSDQANYGNEFRGYFYYFGETNEDRSVFKISYDANRVEDKGYLNYFEIRYWKYLKAYGNELIFYSNAFRDTIIKYDLSEFNNSHNLRIFDITKYNDVKIIDRASISGGQCSFLARENDILMSKYIAVNENGLKRVKSYVKVSNSNIRGSLANAKYVIIAHKNFANAAEKLKNFRINHPIASRRISSETFYIDEIFNEFSGGMVDPVAIRDFLRYAYLNWEIKPEFVLLLGDGDYDSKNREGKNNNFIPTYQTENSLSYADYSYCSDDFFGCIVGGFIDNILDIAIGRVPCRTNQEALDYINKVIKYETDKNFGLWRTKVVLIADDGLTSKGNDGSLHTSQSEDLAKYYIPSWANIERIYLSAYPTVVTGLGRRKPEAAKATIEAMNNGACVINFIGHGNPDVWTHEVIFEKNSTIPQLKSEKYFFLTAATCDFARFDVPSEQSGAEMLLVKPDGGAIALSSANRVVYAGLNAALNNLFYFNLFKRNSDGSFSELGKAYLATKQLKYSSNDKKFNFLGDPYIKILLPERIATIDSIQGVNLQSSSIQLKALGSYNLNASIKDSINSIDINFNGEAIISVYDSDVPRFFSDINYTVYYPGGLIYSGRNTLKNGVIASSFRIPKDITYSGLNGSVKIYFYNNEIDGVGFTRNVIVGGSEDNVENDGKGPDIYIFFDNENDFQANVVNSTFSLIIRLKDETGLNTTGAGIGHKIEAVFNDNRNNPIDLSPYFIGDLDANGKSGKIIYQIKDMQPGNYKIEVKAWDIFNNYSITSRTFTVVSEGELVIKDLLVYPNPITKNGYFTFQRSGTNLIDVTIKIFSTSGRYLQTIEKNMITDKFVKIFWDGKDRDGSSLANGTYLYKLIVREIYSRKTKELYGKLSIVR